MTNLYFEELMAEFGCKSIRETAFGAAEGFPYSAELLAAGEKPRMAVRFLLDAPAAPALPILKQNPIPYIQWKAEDNVLLGNIKVPSDFYAKVAIRMLLSAGTRALPQAGLAPPHTCPLCGQPHCDTYAYLNSEYRETHARCLADKLDLPDKDYTPPVVIRGNYVTGIIGALLGAILGAIPIWALALSRGRVYSAFYAFIPILSTLMFRLFRGKARRNYAGLAVFVPSVAMAFVLEQIWYWIVQADASPYPISLWQTMAQYIRYNSFGSAVYPMLFPLAFLIAGFFPAAVVLRQYAAHGQEKQRTVRGAPYVRDSAQPINPADTPETDTAADTSAAGAAKDSAKADGTAYNGATSAGPDATAPQQETTEVQP